MTRYSYAGGAADFVFDVAPSGFLRLRPASLMVFTEENAGVRVTDLRVDGTPVTEVPVANTGLVPAFEGPDEYVDDLWVATGPDKPRIRLTSNAGEQRADAAADRAEEALDQARQITGIDDVEGAVEALDANPASPLRQQQDARLAATYVGGTALVGPGIDPTGATDSTAAIQAKLDAVRVAGGGLVFVPPGTYSVTGNLRLGSNTRLMGAGWKSVIRLAAGTNTTQANSKHVLTNHDPVGGNQGIHIESLWIDGNGDANPGGHYCGILLDKVTNAVISKVKVTDPLRHNNIEDTHGEGIKLENCTYGRVSDCTVDHSNVLNSKDGIKLDTSSYCTVTGNILINCNAAGVQVAYDSFHCTVTGNSVYSNGDTPGYDRRSMVRLHRASRCTVTGNNGYNVEVGIDLLEGADYNTIVGNHAALFNGAVSACILIRDHLSTPSTGNVITGNTFTSLTGLSTLALVSIARGVANFIRGNQFHTGQASARTITLDANSSNNAIEGNEIRAVQQLTVTNLGTGNAVEPIRESRFVGFKLKRITNQTVVTNTLTDVKWNAEDWDSDGFRVNGSDVATITIPAGLAGKYELAAGITFAGNGTTTRRSLYIRVNGTSVARTNRSAAAAGDDSHHVTAVQQLAAGDVVTIAVYHEAGGPLEIDTTAYGTSAAWITGKRIAT